MNNSRLLPSAYLEVLYLESTGELYIDLGVTANNTTKVDCQFNNLYSSTNINDTRVNFLFSAAKEYDANAYEQVLNNGFTTYGSQEYKTFAVTTGVHTIVKDKNKVYLDGVLQATFTELTFETPNTVYLCGIHRQNRSGACNDGVIIYYYKQTNNNVVVRDLIPCKRISDSKPGMYDLVTNTFLTNSGSGADFICGPAVLMLTVLKERNNSPIRLLLPEGVELYDYIESNGTQYINTLFCPTDETKTYIKFKPNRTNATDHVIYSSSIFSYGLMFGSSYRLDFNKSMYSNLGTTSTDITEAIIYKGLTINNTVLKENLTDAFTSGASLYIGVPNYIGHEVTVEYPSWCFKGRIYACKIWSDNGVTLVRNFLPCKYNGVAGMWDTVTNSFFGNLGSGSFTVGSKVELKAYLNGITYNGTKGTWNRDTLTFTENSSITLGAEIPQIAPATVSNVTSVADSSCPRYKLVYSFDSNTDKIGPITVPALGDNFTFSWWEYCTVFNGDDMPWGYANGNRLNPFHNKCLNTGDSSQNPWLKPGTTTAIDNISTAWHHWAVTGNGTANYLYIDGVKTGLSTSFKGATGTTLWINGWGSNTNWTSSTMKMSDFKIFNTALTDNEVYKLYKGGLI